MDLRTFVKNEKSTSGQKSIFSMSIVEWVLKGFFFKFVVETKLLNMIPEDYAWQNWSISSYIEIIESNHQAIKLFIAQNK